ncbi:MAG: hypothetical protein ACE5NP_08845 [Anaerolineae bacterium]
MTGCASGCIILVGVVYPPGLQVYPDGPLAEQARQRGWEILGEMSPVQSRRL